MKTKEGFIPIIILLIVILVATGIGAALLLSKPSPKTSYPSSTPQTYTTSPNSQTNQTDFPPLYPNVKWGVIENGEYNFRDSNQTLLKKEGSYITTTTTYSSDTTEKFLKYYKDKLENSGWKLVGIAGGGVEEVDDYQKLDKYFSARTKLESNGSKLMITYSK